MKNKYLYILLFSLFIFSACSSSDETTKENNESEPEIYVFDDVSESDDSTETEVTPPSQPTIEENNGPQYFVQVGAFTTQKRADQFVAENSSNSKYNLKITYSEDVRLFVVRIPPFTSKEEAEKVRNEFWKSGLFNDAFIVTQ